MSFPRFFLDSVDADRLTITGEDARHALRSLRIRPGEVVAISDGRGAVAIARVVAADAALEADVIERNHVPAPAPRVTVYQSIPKQGRLDDAADALTQVGVDHIVPVVAQRTVPRWDERKARAHVERLRSIVREASMQSRRAWIPSVGDVIAIAAIPPDTIVLHEEAPQRLRDVLPSQAPERIALATGPEGGFDPQEIEDLSMRGCPVASLGPHVLRTELAPVIATALVAARYGALG